MNKETEKFFRFEFKYILDPVTYMKVKDFVSNLGLSPDKNSKDGPYEVTSMYFDTHAIDDYYDKAGGFLRRKKVRARIYGPIFGNQASATQLEVKHKHDMYIKKRRVEAPFDSWQALANCRHDSGSEFSCIMAEEGRVPTCIVSYKREAFIESFFSKVRLTFDHNIKVLDCKGLEYRNQNIYDTVSVSDSEVVMEIKFDRCLPWWFGLMVKRFGLKRDAYSKYSRAMDKIYRLNPLPQ